MGKKNKSHMAQNESENFNLRSTRHQGRVVKALPCGLTVLSSSIQTVQLNAVAAIPD